MVENKAGKVFAHFWSGVKMKKIVLISLIIVGLLAALIIAALVKNTGDIKSEPIDLEKKPDAGYISGVTASGVQVDLELRSTDASGRLIQVHGIVPRTEAAPATYKPENIQIQGTKDGDKWQMVSRGPWGGLETIRVESGVTTELKVGPPLTVRTDVAAKDEGVSVGLSIFGQAGERYHPGVQKNGERQPAPELKIVDEAGKVLATGNFAYG
jgi:hypothetical protein